MRVNTFIAVGVVFAVIGLLGLTYIFPKMMCISGQDFADQLTVDANGVETFGDFDSGDSVTMVDAISRMEYVYINATKIFFSFFFFCWLSNNYYY